MLSDTPAARSVTEPEASGTPARRSPRPGDLAREYGPPLAVALALVALWETAVATLRIPRFLLPPPSAVLVALLRYWEILVHDAWITVTEILLGFGLGALVGLGLAIGMVFSRRLERVLYPLTIVTQVVPKLAVAPLFIIWFGVGLLPKVMIGAVVSLFPVLVNAMAGMRSVDPRMLDLMHSISASRWQVFTKVRFPNAIPYIFAGLKVGITLAVVGAIIGEWLGANAGLGHQILLANSQLRADLLFAALLVLAGVGLALFGALVVLEMRLVRQPHAPHLLDRLP